MASTRETKTLAIEGIGFSETEGIIEGFAAVTGNVDAVGDRIIAGAFAKTLNDHAGKLGSIPMGTDHEDPLGVTVEMAEVGRGDLPAAVLAAAPDATGGLYCKGQVVMMGDNLERLAAIRDSRTPPRMSFTYNTIIERKSVVNGRAVRDLAEVRVLEWGPALRRRAVNTAAQVVSVKSAYAPAGSFEDLRDRIGEAIRVSGMFGEGADAWVRATMPDHVLVSVTAPDGPTQHYRVDYAQVSGTVALGDASEVDLDLTVTEKAAEIGLREMVDLATADMKAGRVLSRRNLDALEEAIESLRRIRAAAMGTDDEGDDAGDMLADPSVKAAAARLWDDRRFEIDLGLTQTRAALAALTGG